MPTYQYACTACGEEHEAVQSFTDAALTKCPACQGLLRKVYSAVGVVFKGSGFYKNDSRNASGAGKPGSADKADKGDKGDKAGSADKPAKTDTAASSTDSTKATAPKPAASTPASKTA